MVADTQTGPAGLIRRSLLMAGEMRAAAELVGCGLAAPLFAALPEGDGHPVLVVPGLLTDDRSTWPLRHFLKQRRYAVYGWDQGFNLGPDGAVLTALAARLVQLADLHGVRLSLIGISVGGLFAREAAKRHPPAVRQLITLGTPTRPAEARAVAADGPLETLCRALANFEEEMSRPAPVPTTAIVSRSDGLVDWRRCREAEGPLHESVEVVSSHLGLGHNPLCLAVIADRLAQPEGCWRPYAPVGWPALLSGPVQAGI